MGFGPYRPAVPTTVLNNDAGSITFTAASPQSEPALFCEGDSSGVLWQRPDDLYSVEQWAQGPLEDIKPSGHHHEVCF